MTDKELLQKYVDLVPFLNEILGDGSEIVVHDITHPKRSLVAIANPITGRKIGSPLTDFGKELFERGLHTKEDYVANYDGSAKSINFLSSTYFIKNEGRLIGMLCINKNLSASREISKTLLAFLKQHNLGTSEDSVYHENLDTKVEDYVESRVAHAIAINGVSPDRLKVKEKIAIVKNLNDIGVLKLKGAIEETAKQLSVSIPTIYRYLKK